MHWHSDWDPLITRPATLSSSRYETVYSVACLGLEWTAEVSLKSLLGLLKDRMSVAWRHSEDLNADVIIYNPASPLAHALMRRDGGNRHRHVFVPCSANDPGPTGLPLPLGSGRLLRCLENALAQIGNREAHRHAEAPHLCQRLDELLQSRTAAAVTLSVDGQCGFLEPAQQLIHWPSRLGPDEVAQLLMEEVRLEPVSNTNCPLLRLIRQSAVETMPWDAALWAVGVGTSGGRLLARVGATQRYRLTRWPDFGLIGRRSTDLKCSALMVQQALSPLALQAATGFPAATVHNFFNACALCGFLEPAGSAADAAPAVARSGSAPASGGVLARIRMALGMA
jgi:hypothetical protein